MNVKGLNILAGVFHGIKPGHFECDVGRVTEHVGMFSWLENPLSPAEDQTPDRPARDLITTSTAL